MLAITSTVNSGKEARVNPLAVLPELLRFDFGQADDFVRPRLPTLRAGGLEELRLVAYRLLVDGEALLVGTYEDDDNVVEVFDITIDSVSFAVLSCLYQASDKNKPNSLCDTLVSIGVVCAAITLGFPLGRGFGNGHHWRCHYQACNGNCRCRGVWMERWCDAAREEVDEEHSAFEQESCICGGSNLGKSHARQVYHMSRASEA